MHEILMVAMGLCVFAPFVMSLLSGLLLLGRASWLQELTFYRMCMTGLLISLASSVAIAISRGADAVPVELDFGHWVIIGNYDIPALFYMDNLAQAFSLMGAGLTALIARFSQTYLHKEAGFGRFFVILGVFASSTQLVAWAGALDLFFAGWEAIGLCSALFIGYFYERDEPVRSGLRAFATYRLCDAGFLIAIVSIHELIGSTRISGLTGASELSESAITIIAVMLMIAAFGKSAQLPFSTWLPRAMEGPTPASALFYGAVSIHVGLFLLLRISPVLEAAPLARGLGVVVGVLTAIYASLVARTNTDAKGALAHATLGQIGLILAEICLGFTTFALFHLVTHALLRIWQFLRAPNTLADTHTFGHHTGEQQGLLGKYFPRAAIWLYAQALNRFRLDDRMDSFLAPALWSAEQLRRIDEMLCKRLSLKSGDKP